jgi:hypothetical protein
MVMRIVTKFTTEGALVEAFSRYCTATSCFIPSLQARKVGGEIGFSIRLADGTLMVRGMCTVVSSWADDANPFGRPGVQLGITSITPETRAVFDRLCRANVDDEHERATVEMAPLFPPAELHEEPDNAGVPEPANVDSTTPISAPATLLSLVAGRRTEESAPLPAELPADPTVKTARPAAMTLLGVAPITRAHRSTAPRIAMPALSPSATPPQPLPVASAPAERATAALVPRRRRSVWSRVFGRVSALLRTLRWAYRRRRGVRATLRRLPTRT